MTGIDSMIRLAGALQIAIALGNTPLPKLLRYSQNLTRLDPIVRQIFIVHYVFILLVLLIFGVLSLGFAEELTAETPLATYLSGSLAVFWLLRLGIQLLYYDWRVSRQYPLMNLMFLASVAFLGGTYLWACLV